MPASMVGSTPPVPIGVTENSQIASFAFVDVPMPIKAAHLNSCLASANAEMARDDRRWHIAFTPTAR